MPRPAFHTCHCMHPMEMALGNVCRYTIAAHGGLWRAPVLLLWYTQRTLVLVVIQAPCKSSCHSHFLVRNPQRVKGTASSRWLWTWSDLQMLRKYAVQAVPVTICMQAPRLPTSLCCLMQVRNIVNTGRTMVSTIHQPSIDIFEVRLCSRAHPPPPPPLFPPASRKHIQHASFMTAVLQFAPA